MKIGLIDVDGHNFPNLALMRISSYHKSHGDTVEWWYTDFIHYDVVYMSKIFSDTYSEDIPEPMNADKVIKGGTGYCISLVDGKEVFDKSKNTELPPEIERCFPDYSLYPQYDFAVSMTSRGCPRGCAFCHVAPKEGRCSKKVADVSDFWKPDIGKKEIKVLDPNVTACKEKRDLLRQYRETGAWIDFTQGLDIRLLNDEDIADINAMKIKDVHFAWDNPKDDLREAFLRYKKNTTHKQHGAFGTVYVLTNYDSTMEENLYRINFLRENKYDPYVMVYDKPNAPKVVRHLQRWCNNRILFKSCTFEEYMEQKNKEAKDRENRNGARYANPYHLQ